MLTQRSLRVAAMDIKGYANIPQSLYDAITFLAQALPKRSVPTFLELLFGAMHPMTQGKIERWHRTMKNIIKLQNYYMPGALETEIAAFVDHYNHQRVHESLDNLTPADVYHGRSREVLTLRNELKEQTLRRRRRENLGLPPLKMELIRPQMLREGVS